MFKLEQWSKSFGQRQILKNIDLSADRGQVLTIIGSSGSGKSTLLRTINFLEKPDHGFISLGDQQYDVEQMTAKEMLDLRRRTAMVFQNYALFSKKTVLENVMENLITVKKMSLKEARALAESYLEKVGMKEYADQYPNRISGGQKQRVGIARALAIQPKLILLDEPTSALDPEMVGGILELIQSIAHKETTLLIVTHEMKFARNVSDQVVFLSQGEIHETGTPTEIFDHPNSDKTRAFIEGFTDLNSGTSVF